MPELFAFLFICALFFIAFALIIFPEAEKVKPKTSHYASSDPYYGKRAILEEDKKPKAPTHLSR
jgi:hypothetical protein